MAPDTQPKGSDQPLTDKLENLEEGDKVEVNSVDGTLTVKEENLLDYLLTAEDGTRYSLTTDRLNDDCLRIEPCSGFSDGRLVRELEMKNQPETFIQDREKTDSRPETGDRFVLTTVYPNGDVEDHAYSNDRDDLEELMDEVEK
jgi:hypothetical protein